MNGKILLRPVIFIFGLSIWGCSCTTLQERQINHTLKQAASNSTELEAVIHYYEKEQPDEQKYKAACFLIANMNGHFSIQSEALDRFQDEIEHYTNTEELNMPKINKLWKGSLEKRSNRTTNLYDAQTLSSDFLIDNIEKSFATWENSAWKSEVDFETFCQYILPYRFQNELLPTMGWRDSLYNEYFPLIAGEKDIKKACAVIQAKVWSQIGSGSSDVPYIINVLALKHQKRATCIQRCVLLGSILRSVGIPVAIDNVVRWANYSRTGHSWISMNIKEKTYTVYEKDTLARQYNPLDASSFKTNERALNDYPAEGLFKKRYTKIWRTMYSIQEIPNDLNWEWELVPAFVNPFRMDVTEKYKAAGSVSINIHSSTDYVYLCSFASNNWIPVAYEKIKKGKVRFENIGDSVVYLPVIYEDGRAKPMEQPFLLVGEQKYSFIPDTINKRTIVLKRKYPLTGNFLNTWTRFIGSTFEGSQHKNFSKKELLATISVTPGFRSKIEVKQSCPYQYIRFVTPTNCIAPVTELEWWNNAQRLTGTYFCEKATFPERSSDNDTFTPLGEIKEGGYIIGVDFGKPQEITHVIFYAKNDDNYIIPGNVYELFYYDMQWISLGQKRADDFSLTYEGVPSNVLFLLKNQTKGKEERIFVYENDKQVWY